MITQKQTAVVRLGSQKTHWLWCCFLFCITKPLRSAFCLYFEKKKCYNKNGINVNIPSAVDCLKPQAWQGNIKCITLINDLICDWSQLFSLIA